MKNLRGIFVIAALAFASVAFAALKTETIKVAGNCESCKERIEDAAKKSGVKKANWSEKTFVLTVVYDSAKVTNDQIQKRIAAVGHDTEKYKATTEVYNSLPACCKYR